MSKKIIIKQRAEKLEQPKEEKPNNHPAINEILENTNEILRILRDHVDGRHSSDHDPKKDKPIIDEPIFEVPKTDEPIIYNYKTDEPIDKHNEHNKPISDEHKIDEPSLLGNLNQ